MTLVDYTAYVSGTLTTGVAKWRWEVNRPGIVRDVALTVSTPPAGSAIIVDVDTHDGTTLTSMFSARPQIDAGTARSSARPDSTYVRRCLAHASGAVVAGSTMTLDIDQIGSTTAGANLFAFVRVLQFARPLEAFLDYNQIN